jgi:hypothetical protein
MLTNTVALPVADPLFAITWNVPGVAGAVYKPLDDTEPPDAPSCTDHVNVALAVLPESDAMNCTVPDGATCATAGLTATPAPASPVAT